MNVSYRFLAPKHDSVENFAKKSKVAEILGCVQKFIFLPQIFKNRDFSKVLIFQKSHLSFVDEIS
jgi:hypothetical protein